MLEMNQKNAPAAPTVSRPKFRIPEIPVLGQYTATQLIDAVYRAVVDEATTIEFYTRLLRDAPDERAMEYLSDIIEEEKNHLTAFTKLYVHFTDMVPHYKVAPVQYSSYADGLLKAFDGELKAVDFYKETQLSTTDALTQETYYFAMVDELEHADMFGLLYGMAT
jgi:rubrerythrin